MEKEQARVTEVLELALQMETDGQEFYLKAGQNSGNKLTRDLFERLAKEEDAHRKRFEQIYEAIKRERSWPDIELETDQGKGLRSLFAQATSELGKEIKVADSEFEALKVAMDMEQKSYDLYHRRIGETTSPVERRFYETLAGEERGHRLALSDAHEYLSDPAGWFTKAEHWSLDGA